MISSSLLATGISVLVLLLISAFFSCAETGLTAISRTRLHRLEKQGDKRARQVAKLREQKELLIGTILLGNNMVNILASALTTSLAIQLFGNQGLAIATVVVTLAVLIFSEVLPKTYAIQHTEAVALRVAPVFTVLLPLFAPVTRMVEWIVRMIMRMFRMGQNVNMPMITAADAIRGTIEFHHEQGEVIKQDRDMLGSILDLQELDVGDIMVHRKQMMSVNAGLKAEEIVEAVVKSNHTRLPLWQDDPENIIGVLHAKDVLRALRQKGTVGKDKILALAMEPWFIPETTSLKDQLLAFRRKRNHFALVVDEYGALKGIVTLEDILEEIVGDIADEHDQIAAGIRRQKDGSVVVDGSVSLRDLNRATDWELPDEEASTVAGLVMHETRTIPDERTSHEFHGCRFTVMKKRKNELLRLKIERLPKAEEAS